jgi:hypothetical protein
MRFDRFVAALAVHRYSEALAALLGPVEAGNWCGNHACSNGNNNCPQGCTCRHGTCRGQK